MLLFISLVIFFIFITLMPTLLRFLLLSFFAFFSASSPFIVLRWLSITLIFISALLFSSFAYYYFSSWWFLFSSLFRWYFAFLSLFYWFHFAIHIFAIIFIFHIMIILFRHWHFQHFISDIWFLTIIIMIDIIILRLLLYYDYFSFDTFYLYDYLFISFTFLFFLFSLMPLDYFFYFSVIICILRHCSPLLLLFSLYFLFSLIHFSLLFIFIPLFFLSLFSSFSSFIFSIFHYDYSHLFSFWRCRYAVIFISLRFHSIFSLALFHYSLLILIILSFLRHLWFLHCCAAFLPFHYFCQPAIIARRYDTIILASIVFDLFDLLHYFPTFLYCFILPLFISLH